MTQESKDLLLQDLCGRLPYDVKVDIIYSKDSGSSLRARLCSEGINILNTSILWIFQQSEIYIKPYLFPLSSMTEEQCEKFKIISGWNGEWEDIKRGKFSCIGYVGLDYIYDTIDWLNKKPQFN